MAASRIEGEAYFRIDNEHFNEEIQKVISSVLPLFDKAVKSYMRFTLAYSALFVAELLLLLIFSPFAIRSSLFAFSLAGLFLTLFSFFILKIYFLAKKGERQELFVSNYSRGCRMLIGFREGVPEHHIALANAYSKLANALHGREASLLYSPSWLPSLQTTLERASKLFFWKDSFLIKEALLKRSIEEHIKLVVCEPTSLDIHAALANAYVMLSSLYLNILKPESASEKGPSLREEERELLEKSFRNSANKAIEEFKILNDYAPNDPWVHSQLAYSYRDLKMPEEEIQEYEVVLELRPSDIDTLYNLGCLYFQQELNAKGLKVYEKLKQLNYKMAEKLISHYGNREME